MSLERPSNSSKEKEKTDIEQKIAELENVKAELNLIRNSLTTESNTSDAAMVEQDNARAAEQAASDEMIKAEGTDDARADLASSQERVAGADEWAATVKKSPTVEPGQKPTGAFADKLASLGVDFNGMSDTGVRGIRQAISNREGEVEREIRELKLEVPGGKEDMAIEAIKGGNMLDEDKLETVAEELKTLTSTLGDATPEKIVKSLRLDTSYPAAVQKSVAWQMLQAALPKVDEKRIPETQEKLTQLRPQIEALIDQST